MRINEYPKATTLPQENVILTDGSETGTKAIGISTLATQLLKYIDQNSLYAWYDEMRISVEDRRKVYRGKNLGDQITPEQQEAIRTGLFTDLFIGDYWLINEVKYLILDFDYYWGAYIDPSLSDTLKKHHITIFLENAKEDMVSFGDFRSGIKSSLIWTYLRPLADKYVYPIFGVEHIQDVTISLFGKVENGLPTAYEFSPVKLIIPSALTFSSTAASLVTPLPFNINNANVYAYFNHKQPNGNWAMWFRDVTSNENPAFSNRILSINGLRFLPISGSLTRYLRPVFNLVYDEPE